MKIKFILTHFNFNSFSSTAEIFATNEVLRYENESCPKYFTYTWHIVWRFTRSLRTPVSSIIFIIFIYFKKTSQNKIYCNVVYKILQNASTITCTTKTIQTIQTINTYQDVLFLITLVFKLSISLYILYNLFIKRGRLHMLSDYPLWFINLEPETK